MSKHILYYCQPERNRSYLCPALAEHTAFVVSVRSGSQLTGVPWDLRLAGHTSATHTFLVFFIFLKLYKVFNNEAI